MSARFCGSAPVSALRFTSSNRRAFHGAIGVCAAGLDYLDHVRIVRHSSYDDFCSATAGRRQVLLSTRASAAYAAFRFRREDILLLGRESSGVPETVHQRADQRLVIPMRANMRSLNVAVACAMVLGEALRQTRELHFKS